MNSHINVRNSQDLTTKELAKTIKKSFIRSCQDYIKINAKL